MTAEEAIAKTSAELKKRMKDSPSLQKLLRRINSGKATFADTAAYSDQVALMVGDVLSDCVRDPQTTRFSGRVAEALLKEQYEEINSVMQTVQAALDKQRGLHIAPQKAALPLDRIKAAAYSLVDVKATAEQLVRRAESAPVTVVRSYHDQYIHENARFRSSAGLRCFLVRTTDGKCCKWCSAKAGRYAYGEHPEDIFRRHDNCGCTVTYENGRQRQDVWSKRTWESDQPTPVRVEPTRLTGAQGREIEQRNLSQITRFSHAQGEAVQGRNLRYRGLTSGANSGIIKARGFTPLSDSRVVPVLRKESKQWIAALNSEEIRAIKKYTKNSGDPADDKFYARLNAMLRGEIPEDKTLLYYSDLISGALRKNQLKHDIVCYRNMDINPYSGLPVGSVFSAKQFYSASVTKNGTLQGKIQMIIYAHKGAKGAYIESLSKYPKQREFLLDKGCIYKILSNNGSTIEVEVIV